jgi:hypothetical protein
VAANLHEWHEFYLMLGSAAAALLALLFVAVSVGEGFLTERNAAETRTYFSPIVVHFAASLFLSAVALAPVHHIVFTAVLIGLTGIVGLAISTFISVRVFLRHGPMVTTFDHFAYGVIPAVAYLGLVASALLICRDWAWSLEFFAGSQLVLLLISIRNAWDLILTTVRQRSRRKR